MFFVHSFQDLIESRQFFAVFVPAEADLGSAVQENEGKTKARVDADLGERGPAGPRAVVVEQRQGLAKHRRTSLGQLRELFTADASQNRQAVRLVHARALERPAILVDKVETAQGGDGRRAPLDQIDVQHRRQMAFHPRGRDPCVRGQACRHCVGVDAEQFVAESDPGQRQKFLASDVLHGLKFDLLDLEAGRVHHVANGPATAPPCAAQHGQYRDDLPHHPRDQPQSAAQAGQARP